MSPLGNRKVLSDWVVNIGEYALDIRLSRLHLSQSQNEDESKTSSNHSENKIVVLGERTLFCITIRGELIYQRRLDYEPISMCTYPVQPDRESSLHNIILASTESVAFVYGGQDQRVLWTAKLSDLKSRPVVMTVSKFKDTNGLLVALDEHGSVVVSFMGTFVHQSHDETRTHTTLPYQVLVPIRQT